MPKVKIRAGDWVVVCDGAKALILENVGDDRFPNLKTKEVYEQKLPATSALGSAAPGRVHQSSGTGRAAIEQTNFHDQAERAFLNDLAGRLDAAIGAGETKCVLMIAPPRALGMLRQAYSPALRQALRAEIDKDYVKMPVHEIEKHLAG